MYIFLPDSANGFVKWAGDFQPEKIGDARHGADEVDVIAARAQRATTLAEQPHLPWFVPGAGRL
jgi:hypothetical protein